MTEVNGTLTQWRQLARWLEERGIRSLAGCDAGVLDDYVQHLRDSGHSRKHILVSLVALTPLWALDQLSARPYGIARVFRRDPSHLGPLTGALTGSTCTAGYR
jgi:hypothetical protein